ncbi:MAG: hypothetical protein JWR05_426 [Mucilaginibacter sp.]|nr:hypothetical protein [Mucilaginibacter sp.]
MVKITGTDRQCFHQEKKAFYPENRSALILVKLTSNQGYRIVVKETQSAGKTRLKE